MISNKAKLSLITLTLILICFLAIIVFGIYDIKAKDKETLKLLSEAQNVKNATDLIQSVEQTQEKFTEDVLAFESLVFVNDKLVPFIENIESAGRKLGLETDILSVARIKDEKSVDPDKIRITINTKGSWASTVSFMRAIENLPYRVMMEDIIFSKGDIGWFSKIIISIYSFD